MVASVEDSRLDVEKCFVGLAGSEGHYPLDHLARLIERYYPLDHGLHPL